MLQDESRDRVKFSVNDHMNAIDLLCVVEVLFRSLPFAWPNAKCSVTPRFNMRPLIILKMVQFLNAIRIVCTVPY